MPLILGAAEAPSTAPASSIYARTVQSILGITSAQADVLTPLAAFLEHFPQDAAAADDSLRLLVKSLNAGADPAMLRSMIVDRLHIGSVNVQDPTWKYGKLRDIDALVQFLYARAKELHAKNEPAASAFARAAILLAAHYGGCAMRTNVRMLANDAAFGKIADLSNRQSTELSAFLAAQREIDQNYFLNCMLPAQKALDVLIQEPPPSLPSEQVSTALDAFDKAVAESRQREEFQFNCADYIWRLVLLVRARGTHEQVRLVEERVAKWTADTDAPNLKRWLAESLTVPGKPPLKPLIQQLPAAPSN